MCMCVCVRERERERGRKCVCVTEREWERQETWKRVWEMKVRKVRKRESERERERESLSRELSWVYVQLTHTILVCLLRWFSTIQPPPISKEKHLIQKARSFYSCNELFSSSIKRCGLCPLYLIFQCSLTFQKVHVWRASFMVVRFCERQRLDKEEEDKEGKRTEKRLFETKKVGKGCRLFTLSRWAAMKNVPGWRTVWLSLTNDSVLFQFFVKKKENRKI